jgi:hypothetical protein
VSGPRRLVFLAVIGLAVVVVLAYVATSFGRPPTRTETGVVVAVERVSLTDVRGFTLRTTDGRTVAFRIGSLENAAQFALGHLGEHQATSTPILVTYRVEGGENVAVRLEDAPAASAPPG